MEQRDSGAVPAGPSRSSGSGTWQLGADWGQGTRTTRSRCWTRRSRPASPSSTPPTSTATAAASSSSARLLAEYPGRPAPSRPRWAAASRRTRRTTRWRTSAPGPTARGPTSASTRSTWSSCTARRPPCLRHDAVLRRARHAGRRAAHRGLRRQRRDLRRRRWPRSPGRTSPACRSSSTLPAQAARAGAARRAGGRGRHHRAGPARLRPAVRPVHPGYDLRARTTTATTTGTARPSMSAKPSPGVDFETGRGGGAGVRRPGPGRRHARAVRAALGHRAARRHHRDPGRSQPRSGPARTRRPPACAAAPKPNSMRSKTCMTGASARWSTTAGSPGRPATDQPMYSGPLGRVGHPVSHQDGDRRPVRPRARRAGRPGPRAWSSALRFWLSLCFASTVAMVSSTPTIARSCALTNSGGASVTAHGPRPDLLVAAGEPGHHVAQPLRVAVHGRSRPVKWTET